MQEEGKKNFNISLIILRKKVMHLVYGALKKELSENQILEIKNITEYSIKVLK